MAALASYQVVDTAPEAAFDDIVELIADICDAQMALVSLVDDQRQWFKSRIGVEAPETPRSMAFCAHAILQDEPLIIRDAALDPRFAANPLVAGPMSLRFYAGAPLIAPDGHRLGTLCVLDTKARPEGLSDRQLRALKTLAGRVMSELELRRAAQERTDALAKLTRSEERLQRIVNAGIIGIAYGGPQSCITGANDAFLAIIGRTHSDIDAGLEWPDITPPEYLPLDRQRLAAAVRTGNCSPYEKEYLRPDGSRVPVLVGYALDASRGDAVVFIVDLTEQKRTAQRLRESQARLNLALDVGSMGIFDWDLKTGHIDWSPGHYDLFGYAEGEVTPSYEAWAARVHPDDLPGAEAAVGEAMASRTGYWARYRVVRPGRDTVWITAEARAEFSSDGEPQRMIGLVRDVTAQMSAEAERAAGEARLRAIVDTAVDAIIVIDEAGLVKSFNPAAERLFGYASSEMIGQNIAVLMPPTDAARHDRYVGNFVQTGVPKAMGIGRELQGKRKDGTQVPFEAVVTDWRDKDGRRFFTGILRDLTERKAAEAELAQARASFERVSRLSAMGAMAATLAHELNQPLAAMTNYVAAARRMLAKAGRLDGKIDEALQEAATEALHAGQIIRRIRTFTATGQVTRRPEHLARIVALAVEAVRSLAADAAVELVQSVPPSLVVDVDPVQIEQVLVNLMRNSIQATASSSPARVEVSATAKNGVAEIRVADTGPGISQQKYEALFQPFLTEKEEGLGLGLPICRTIVEAHGGRIWAEPPTLGAGAVFRLTVPIA